MGEGALASARGFAGVLTAKLRRAIVWELRTLTPPAVSSSPGQRDYQPSSKLGRCDRIPCCPLLGAFSWFCCRGSDLLQKEVRMLFNCSSKIQQLIQQKFQSVGNVYQPTKLLWGLDNFKPSIQWALSVPRMERVLPISSLYTICFV